MIRYKTSVQAMENQGLCLEFFAEVVAIGKAAGARFIPLKEYDPLAFHPDQPYTTRCETLKNMWNDWKGDDRRGPIRQLKQHVIACLAANGPLGEPRSGVFLRYATLTFESPD